jgi:hypothetical protein
MRRLRRGVCPCGNAFALQCWIFSGNKGAVQAVIFYFLFYFILFFIIFTFYFFSGPWGNAVSLFSSQNQMI